MGTPAPPELVTLTAWLAGTAPPLELKVRKVGLAAIEGCTVTVNVTGTVNWPLVLAQELVGEHVKVTEPSYVPAPSVASTLLLIDTVSVPGVAPLAGEIWSKFAGVEVADTLYEMGAPTPPELVTLTVWLAGAPTPLKL